MKRQLKVIILFILFGACKQALNNNIQKETDSNFTSIKEDTSEQNILKDSEDTIEVFFKLFQLAVKNNDVAFIEKNIKFPIEFSSGGESSLYNNYNELKEDSFDEFSKINTAKLIENDKKYYKARYFEPDNKEYFVTFYFIKEGNAFKLVGFAEPH